MPLEKPPVRGNRTAQGIVMKREPDLNGGQCKHDACQSGSSKRLSYRESAPAGRVARDPGLSEERKVDESKRCKNNHHGPFEHESHPAHGKMKNKPAAKVEASHPAVSDENEIHLKASSKQIFESK